MNSDFQAIIVNENEKGLPCGQGNGVLIDSDRGIVATVAHGLKRGSKCKVFFKGCAYNATFQHDAVDWSMDMALVTLDDIGGKPLPSSPAIADSHDGDEIIIPGFLPQEGSSEMGILRSYYNLNISKEICPASVTGKIVAKHQSLARMDMDAFLEEVAGFEQKGGVSLEKSRLFYEDYIILEIEGLNQQMATGLSGSPVVDSKGDIVGIFSIILDDGNFKMGAAIPVAEAKRLVSAFIDSRDRLN
ncbi:MAG: serine protease [Anaerolineaceae bacterium]|nr:serine protease [Anaerolineaceae bacterium]